MTQSAEKLLTRVDVSERVTGIEPALSAWESDTSRPCADVLRPTGTRW